MAKNRILFVDDEPDLLEGLERMLFRERKRWQMRFAQSGKEGLAALGEKAFDVVVADMRMPAMNGVEFLQQVKEKNPDTVRMMLTGNTDQETATKAVNDGNVFRFMNKPVERETLIAMIEAGIEQHRLITAEKELLTGTLSGSVRLLTEMLSMADPKAFGHATWLRDSVRAVAQTLKIRNAWEITLAAALSEIGYITLPTDLATKARGRRELSKEEQEAIHKMPQVTHKLLSRIPRLEGVSKIVLYQEKNFDGSGFPADAVANNDIPLGSRIIKIFNDLAHLSSSEFSSSKLHNIMRERRGWYDPQLLEQILPLFVSPHVQAQATGENTRSIPLSKLRIGDKVLSNIATQDDEIIVAAGNRISPTFMEKIEINASLKGIKEPIVVEGLSEKGETKQEEHFTPEKPA